MSVADNPSVHSTGMTRHRAAAESGELLALVFEYLCADAGAPVNSIRFSRTQDGWLLTLKARSAHRGGLICFEAGRTLEDCIEQAFYDVYHDGLKWREDKYA